MKELGVVILAAGASSRMGRPKLLLPWNGTTIIGHLIAQWRGLGAAQIAVVQRTGDAAFSAALDALHFSAADRIGNPWPERGMFSSVLCAAGWRGWQPEITRFAVALGDQPHLRTETLRRLVDFSALNLDAICQPAFQGHAAHPVILPAPVFQALKTTKACSLKEFLKLVSCRRVQHVIDDPGLALDLDTPEDYIQASSSDKGA